MDIYGTITDGANCVTDSSKHLDLARITNLVDRDTLCG